MFFFIILIVLTILAVGIFIFGDAIGRVVGSIAVAIVMLAWTGWNSVYQVPAGSVGLVYSFGDIVNQTGQGLQTVAPWRSVWSVSTQVRKLKYHGKERLASFTQETQNVYVDTTVNVRVDPKDIQGLYRNVGEDFIDILVNPRVKQAFKDEMVKFSAVDVAPHREDIRRAVGERLRAELAARSIIVEDVLLDDINFDDAFESAILRKQVATQDVLAEEQKIAGERNKASQKIEEARGSAEATLVNATKQAEANILLAKSITPELVQYQMVSKLAPNVQTIMLPAGAPFILDKSTFAPAR
jgi:regulator of protease activity HflC (stomatin/prohibitin superfamily)